MDINFVNDSDLIPVPRDEVRIQDIVLNPLPECRVEVMIKLLPFAPMDRPNLEITVTNENRQTVASLSVIETMNHQFSVIIHLRDKGKVSSVYDFRVELYYDDLTLVQDETTATIDVKSYCI